MLYTLNSIPNQETIRYALGAKLPEEIPTEFFGMAQKSAQKILSEAIPSYCLKFVSLQPLFQDILQGNDIQNHLKECSDGILLCATLGAQVDALIRKYQIINMEQALWLDAAASAAIEAVCDGIQYQLAQQLERTLTSRFSCGYGDFPLTAQANFVAQLDAGKKIGLTVSSSGMLVPVKSVTAVIGILPKGYSNTKRAVLPCSLCHLKENCQLRRKGVFCGKQID